MSTTAAILAELAKGPRSTGQLAYAAGISRDGVNSAIRRLNQRGYVVANVRGPSGHLDGLYWLVPAREDTPRTCRMDGCETLLSRSNQTPYCRLHLPGAALDAFIAILESEGTEYEQLAIC